MIQCMQTQLQNSVLKREKTQMLTNDASSAASLEVETRREATFAVRWPQTELALQTSVGLVGLF